MLQCFFEKTEEDKTSYFEDKKIWKEEECQKHFGKYPVIFLTFKDCKEKNLSILQLHDISEILEVPLTHLIEEREEHQFKTKAIKILENAIKELKEKINYIK